MDGCFPLPDQQVESGRSPQPRLQALSCLFSFDVEVFHLHMMSTYLLLRLLRAGQISHLHRACIY